VRRAEPKEAPLGLAASEGTLRRVVDQDAPQPLRTRAAREPLQHPFERPEVEHPPRLGLLDRPGEPRTRQHLSQVHQGPSRTGHRDGIDDGAVLRVYAIGARRHHGAIGRCGAP
jgi:hypothetical protein